MNENEVENKMVYKFCCKKALLDGTQLFLHKEVKIREDGSPSRLASCEKCMERHERNKAMLLDD